MGIFDWFSKKKEDEETSSKIVTVAVDPVTIAKSKQAEDLTKLKTWDVFLANSALEEKQDIIDDAKVESASAKEVVVAQTQNGPSITNPFMIKNPFVGE